MPFPESDWEIAARVFETYPGGEGAFWHAWGRGELAEETMDWFRRHAADVVVEEEVREADARLAARTERRRLLEQPEARRRQRAILEALAFAVEMPGKVTRLLRSDAMQLPELRRRFRDALFDVLEHDLGIDPSAWSGSSEAAVGTAVLRVVYPELAPGDDDAPPSFVEISDELRALREPAAPGSSSDPTEQALRRLAGPLLERRPDDTTNYRLEPSFRNYLKARLREACRRLGWRPRPIEEGGRFDELDAALAALSPRRVTDVFAAVAYAPLNPWLAVDDLVAAH